MADPVGRPLRVLMLGYFYPPMGGAGVQRALKFSRYLPDYGVLPEVVCASGGGYPQDASLLEEIPHGLDVTRIPHTPLVSRLLSVRQRLNRLPAGGSVQGGGTSPNAGGVSPWRDRFLGALGALQYPDDKVSWARDAVRVAARRRPQSPVDLILSSSPPVSGHWAAMRLAAQARLPWVADFRDLWTDNPAYTAPAWRRTLDRRLERRLLRSTQGIVAVSEPMAGWLAQAVGPGVPVICIPNGYDEDDFAGLEPALHDRMTYDIVHAGTFYGDRSPEPFLRGVARAIAIDGDLQQRLRIRLVGSIGSRFDQALDLFEKRFPEVLERTGYVDHARALVEVLGADALLLVVGGDDNSAAGVLTGKIFEYLRAGRPILLVGPAGSEAARLIGELGAGEVVDPNRPEEIARHLRRWVLDGAAPQPDPGRATRFERKALTATLAAFLAEVHGRYRARA